MITATDIEQMSNAQLVEFFKSEPSFEIRQQLSQEFMSEEDETKRYQTDKSAEQIAKLKGFAIREFQDFDIKFIKRMVFVVIIPAYIDKIKGTFADVFNEYAKCSRKTCPNPATHYLYKLSGVGKGSWKTTVKRKQYCKTCLDKIVNNYELDFH